MLCPCSETDVSSCQRFSVEVQSAAETLLAAAAVVGRLWRDICSGPSNGNETVCLNLLYTIRIVQRPAASTAKTATTSNSHHHWLESIRATSQQTHDYLIAVHADAELSYSQVSFNPFPVATSRSQHLHTRKMLCLLPMLPLSAAISGFPLTH